MVQLSSIKIERFKRIKSIDIDLKDITVLIGGNNSGKSSFLQGAHFAITTVQSAVMAGQVNTLSVDQLIYKPANDPMLLNTDYPMTQSSGPRFTFSHRSEPGDDITKYDVYLYRGKNANISVSYQRGSSFYARASDRTQPLSIFVPGLAGIALREERRSEAILNTGIAQGDSNLYLRNVLLRIINNKDKLRRFHDTIQTIFPELLISTDFEESRHLYINIGCQIAGRWLPLELVGTGCLQAIQLVAYATMYDPALLLLDEPDAHLHPSNQRLLANTLVNITQRFGTKIVLSTHSRHMFDALKSLENIETIWLQHGMKKEFPDRSDLSLLLDLGALDSFEMLASGLSKVVVLTEDTKSYRLQTLLEANGFKKGEYVIQPFHGVDQLQASIPVADFFTKLGHDTHVLIHRDGDALQANEKEWLASRMKHQLPGRTTLFITGLTDIEHYFCQTAHIESVYGITATEAEFIVSAVMERFNTRLAIEFANKRRENKDKILRSMPGDPPSAISLTDDKISFEQARGKTLFGHLLTALHDAGHNSAKLTSTYSAALEVQELRDMSSTVWKSVIPLDS